MGEYARSLAIAQGAAARWPEAHIEFILSRRAAYAVHTPFPTVLLDSSPTFHSAAVIAAMQAAKPDVVLFDNAGRTTQLRAARRLGARVVFISARSRQRRRAFRLAWMRLIDEHWIAYPEFSAGRLRLAERLKLRWLKRPVLRYLDVIMTRAPAGADPAPAASCATAPFVLVVPGGGTGHPGAIDAVAQFRGAARTLAQRGVATVFVGPAEPDAPGNQATAASHAGLPRMCGVLPQAALVALMREAVLVVVNGGATLLQALACGRPAVAVAIAGDQAERIRRCTATGAVIAAPLEAGAIAKCATALLDEPERLARLTQRAASLDLADGVAVAVTALANLLGAR